MVPSQLTWFSPEINRVIPVNKTYVASSEKIISDTGIKLGNCLHPLLFGQNFATHFGLKSYVCYQLYTEDEIHIGAGFNSSCVGS